MTTSTPSLTPRNPWQPGTKRSVKWIQHQPCPPNKLPGSHFCGDEALLLVPIGRWEVQGVVKFKSSWHGDDLSRYRLILPQQILQQILQQMPFFGRPVLDLSLQGHLAFLYLCNEHQEENVFFLIQNRLNVLLKSNQNITKNWISKLSPNIKLKPQYKKRKFSISKSITLW